MNQYNSKNIDDHRNKFYNLCDQLIDKQAKKLADKVKWIDIKNSSNQKTYSYPISMLGKGRPILMLHGFDSSFLEFRRIAPILSNFNKVIIPDLHGFGFSPRPSKIDYGPEAIIFQLKEIIEKFIKEDNIGLIGASMGGAIAMELARLYPKRIKRILLLSPAGLTGKAKPIPPPLDRLGVCFLKQSWVRKALCKQAFADPKSKVGASEEQIASIHTNVSGWGISLASFARSGGFGGLGEPLPKQYTQVIFGENDNILKGIQMEESKKLFSKNLIILKNCGHLPHLDHPESVIKLWEKENL